MAGISGIPESSAAGLVGRSRASQPLVTPRVVSTRVKVNAWRWASSPGSTPRIRGRWARFRFRQLASSPSRTRNGTTETPGSDSRPWNSRPLAVFRSCRRGRVVSPQSAKPPVPEERRPASRPASRRCAATPMIRNVAEASRLIVPIDLAGRRASDRRASPLRLRIAQGADAVSAGSRRARAIRTPSNAVISQRAPAPKNCWGSTVRRLQATAVSPTATRSPVQAPQRIHRGSDRDTTASSTPPSCNRSRGRRPSVRSIPPRVAAAMAVDSPTPVARVGHVRWNPSPAPATASRQRVDSPHRMPRA